MASDYVFPDIKDLESLAGSYIIFDSQAKMMARNGMPRELYVNFWIVNQFINENSKAINTTPYDPMGCYSDLCIGLATKVCAEHYNRKQEELIDAWDSITCMDFYDPDLKENLSRQLKEAGLEGKRHR